MPALLTPGVYLVSVSEEVVVAQRVAGEPGIDLTDILAPYVATRVPGVDLTAAIEPYQATEVPGR